MGSNITISFIIAGIIRYLLMISNYSECIRDRVEISTPLNSWKRVREGAYLYNNGIDPYLGDMYHESPFVLVATNVLINNLVAIIPFVFIILDLLTATFLYKMAKIIVKNMLEDQTRELSTYAKDTEDLHLKKEDLINIPLYTAIAYLFNPYSVLNCVGQTTTVWSNFLLALFFYFMSKRQRIPALLVLALEVQRNFYPIVLVVPLALAFADNGKCKKCQIFRTISFFAIILFIGEYLSYMLMGNWKFLNSTYGFIINHRDLQPNIGLFWYFFTEMFDHFRTLFLYTFQINATILYLIPLSFRLKDEPFMLATVLTALSTIFRSYPCVGDVAFYMALLPIWKTANKFMSHNFIVGCFFLVTSVLGPVVWHLWIYSASANANFYFGVTLAFTTAQIFLVTDLLFAFIKRQFCLKHGLVFKIDGQTAIMTLE